MVAGFALILQCLKRFEDQALKPQNREDLVKFFCLEVVPFLTEAKVLEGLRQEWIDQRTMLNKRVQETQEIALTETKRAFHEIKVSVGDSGHENVTGQIELLERLMLGKEVWYGSPLCRVLYDEMQKLLGMLLEAGYQNLCSRFGKVSARTTMYEDGVVQELYMEQFSFAPSIGEAYAALDSISIGNLDDPAVVWWYFEFALWCWRTSEAYFDMSKPSKFDEQNFRMVCTRSAWKEIAGVRDHIDEAIVPVIFTKSFFRKGLKGIINSIMQYAALERGSGKQALSHEPVGTEFELVLDGNELWVHVTFENREKEQFLIQRFHEEVRGEGSGMFRFVKDLLNDGSKGEKRASLMYKWESASKYINRIKLPKELKQSFFGKTYGATYYFAGNQVRMRNSEGVMSELRERMAMLDGKSDGGETFWN